MFIREGQALRSAGQIIISVRDVSDWAIGQVVAADGAIDHVTQADGALD